MVKKTKILVMGLDGATWDILKPWADKGELSAIKMLMENGVWGELESCIPPITMPAWPCMMTGKNPGKIGVIHFLMREKNGYDFKPVKLNVDKLNPVWKFLNEYGKRTNLFYIPNIIPDLSKLHGMYIPGGFVSSNITPYTSEAEKLIEKFQLDKTPPKLGMVDGASYINWWRGNAEKHLKFISHFLNHTDGWDFLMHVIYSNDHLSHLFWKHIDKNHPLYEEAKEIFEAFLNYYKGLDKLLGDIVEKCKSNNVTLFLVSDHGHGLLIKRVDLNKWLEQHGYLRIKSKKSYSKKSLMNLIKQKFLDNSVAKSKSFYRLLKKFPRVKNFLRSFLINLNVSGDVVDWSKTRAYFSGYNGININLKGREPMGIVDPCDYEKTREIIITELKTLRDPDTNKEIVQNVWKKEELYQGNLVHRLPDIIIEYTNVSEYESVFKFSDSIIKEQLFYKPNNPPISSAHTYKGIFLAYGPDIKDTGEKLKNLRIYDVAPMILHMFGLPVPRDMDGRVLTEIFKNESAIAKMKPEYVDPNYYKRKTIKDKTKEKIKELKKLKRI